MRMRRAFLSLALLAALAGPDFPARAQPAPPTDSLTCQQQCGARLPRRQDNPQDVQMCLARCEIRERVQPPPPSRTVRQAPARPPRQQGRANARQAAPAPPAAARPAPVAPPPGAEVRYGVIYLAPPPSRNYGLTVGLADRNAAHRLSEQQCMGPQGAACRLAQEFTDRCGAVAQGLIPRGLFLTNSPTTFNVMIAVPGSGATQPQAEQDAMAGCRQRFRGTCRLAASRCSAPG